MKYPFLMTTYLYLVPIFMKWRIISVSKLHKESNYQGHLRSFQRVLAKLRNEKIIIDFVDPSSKRRFVYLSSVGCQFFELDSNKYQAKTETFSHDLALADICLILNHSPYVNHIILDHEIRERGVLTSNEVTIPDALITGERNLQKFSMAVELEINRKSFQRVHEKFRSYLLENKYSYVAYFFFDHRVMNAYLKKMQSDFGDIVLEKFMFFILDPKILEKESRQKMIGESPGMFKGRSVKLGEIFSLNEANLLSS